MVDTASLFSFKDNGLFNEALVIFNLSAASVVDFEAERDYQDIIKNI